MSSEFITNNEKLLSKIINEIMPTSTSLDALVGYFYFSGFQEIYENVKDKKVRILVGLDAEKGISNIVKEVEYINSDVGYKSKEATRVEYYKSFVSIYNDSDLFDDAPEKQEAFKIFISKLQDGSLEVKKTKDPNHAKMYLFERKEEMNEGGTYKGTLITGSSNLTLSGLKGQHEMNVIFRDDNYSKASDIFEELWLKGIILIDKDTFDKFKKEVLDKIWFDKLPSPYLLYVRLLEEYFSQDEEFQNIKTPGRITKGKFLDLKYQTDAVRDALSILKKHDGVIVADVVGLGKSIIGSAVAHNLDVGKIIVISPPHLKQQWEDYAYEFNFNAKIYGSGSIEKALRESIKHDEKKLIIVDEAHKYRNEETADYASLHELCAGNYTMLLTATPFNNKPSDIFSMIKLFQIAGKTTIKSVDNLSLRFKELNNKYKEISRSKKTKKKKESVINKMVEQLSSDMRDLISPVTIRRSRIDLEAISEYKEDLDKQNIVFPEVNNPKEISYSLGDISELYTATLSMIAPLDERTGFIGARYKPTSYIKPEFREKYEKSLEEDLGVNIIQSHKNLAKLMKRLLVKRFESSIDAFSKTLDSMIGSYEKIMSWHSKGKVPIYKGDNLPDYEYLFNESSDDDKGSNFEDIIIEERFESLKEKGLEIINVKEFEPNFEKELKSDLELLKKIKNNWFGNSEEVQDVKLQEFTKNLKDELSKYPDRKIVVFTEYADTANYLYNKIKDNFKAIKYTSSDSNKVKRLISKNFDAGIDDVDQENDFDVLIATDAISEGYNLHRAGTIFNYDIPYNPTRVVQRVGRINRINKKVFDELFIYNFFPTSEGEQEIRVKTISTLKISVMGQFLGQDTRILTEDEVVKSFNDEFKKEVEDQEKSWDVEYREELSKIKKMDIDTFEKAMSLPTRSRTGRKVKGNKGVIVFGKKGGQSVFRMGINEEEQVSLSARQAMEIFKATKNEKSNKLSSSFDEVYQALKNKLFIRKSEIPGDIGLRRALDKIEVLEDKLPKHKDYLEDMQFLLKELDSLPDKVAKELRAINVDKNLEDDFKEFMKKFPHNYLLKIKKKSELIEEGEENVIFAEELN